MKHNLKIVVLGGGLSSERQVSLVTSLSVCQALRKIGHKAIFVDLFLGIEDYNGDLDQLFESPDGRCSSFTIERTAPDIQNIILSRKDKSSSKIGMNVLEVCKLADCVFLGLHGLDGEDGKIQATLELLGIPYTGSGPLSSALAMDKTMTRMIMQLNGIRCAPLAKQSPCVVKCAHGGSSIGTYICETELELHNALLNVKKFNDDFFIEKKIEGLELTVPILDGKALPPIEIIPPPNGKFDYVAKYQKGNDAATEICPARIGQKKTLEVQSIAENLHKKLGLSVYSRIDFIMDEEEVFWCLEVNTLPGMTSASLLPKSAKEAGIEYSQLCERIVQLSMECKR